jgi:DNA-binding transcriptional LysR family regulator
MTTVAMEWEKRLGRRLRVRDLYILSTVVNSGSMVKAARELAMSQPAVSEAIANLEHILHVRLLDRSPRGVEPTMYADALLRRSMTIFDELKQSVRDIESLADPTTGEMTIGCPDTIAGTFLPPLLQQFSKRYPRVVVNIEDVPSPAIKSHGLRERQFDVILARIRVPLPEDHVVDDFDIEYLFDDPLVITAGMHSKWAHRRKMDIAELVDEPWILPPPRMWNYSWVAMAFKERGLSMPKVSFVTFSGVLKAYFLANGPFITADPMSWARLNGFKILPVGLSLRPWPVAIVTLKNRTLSPVVDRFIECARDEAKSFTGRADRRADPKLDVS